jgi:hypothetical protein
MTIRHAVPAILAAALSLLVLAACGGSNNSSGGAGQSDDEKQLAFADCMRKAGLDVKTADGGRATRLRVPKGVSPARLQKIQRDCTRKTGGGPKELSKADQAKFLDKALKFARCMRAHGINLPDPKAQGGGITLGARSSKGGSTGNDIDPESPAFQRAQNACESLLPGGKGPRLTHKTAAGAQDSDDGPSTDAVPD